MSQSKQKKDQPISVITLPLERSDVTVSSEHKQQAEMVTADDHNLDTATTPHPPDSSGTAGLDELHQQASPSCGSDVKVVESDDSLEPRPIYRSATDVMKHKNQKTIDSQNSVIRKLMEQCKDHKAEADQLKEKKRECDQLRMERDKYMMKCEELQEYVELSEQKSSTLEDCVRENGHEIDELKGENTRLSEEVMQLKSCDELDPYVLTDVEPVEDSNFKEGGSYGSVSLVRINGGVKCIEKRLHDILVGYGKNEKVSEEQKQSISEKFCRECIFLSQMRHPNIIQFMGVRYSESNCLSLIMEFLPMSVDICINRCNSSDIVIPLCFKLSILRDVSYGLLHLHGLSMIHRDLSAGNVLLTSDLRAKIADLGVSKYLTQTELIVKLTKAPGACYIMPPEAFEDNCQYTDKLDVFSFGVLSLELMLQRCPSISNKGITAKRAKGKEIEIGRRIESIEEVSRTCNDGKIESIIRACLQDLPEKRWPITDLKDAFEKLCHKYPSKHEDIIQKLRRLEQELRP